MECNAKDASVVWQPMGDNRAPILTYKIQYNTSFTPDTWETATGKIKTVCNGKAKLMLDLFKYVVLYVRHHSPLRILQKKSLNERFYPSKIG